MYEYIFGNLVNLKEDYVVLENNGIGYRIYTSKNSFMDLKINEEVTMYIDFNVRDDGIFLYGFTTEEELNMFSMLRLVSRIGPKVALGVLSTLTSNEIKRAIVNGNTSTLCNAPGVGKKTAERIVLELKDRIDEDELTDNIHLKVNGNRENIEGAIQGVMSLGYTRGEIRKVLNQMDFKELDTEAIIREVLKRLSK